MMQPIVRLATQTDVPILLDFEQRLIIAERPMDSTIKDGKISYYNISDFIKNEGKKISYNRERQKRQTNSVT